MSHTLTPREQECMKFLQSYLRAYGIGPSYSDICIALGLASKGQVSRIMWSLVAKRAIKRRRGGIRAIELVTSKDNHAADCVCARCDELRYKARLKLVHALEVPAPAWMGAAKLSGIKPLSNLTRTSWRIGFPYHPDERAKPRVKAAQ